MTKLSLIIYTNAFAQTYQFNLREQLCSFPFPHRLNWHRKLFSTVAFRLFGCAFTVIGCQ